MLKKFALLFALGLAGLFSAETAFAQGVSLDIRNQHYSGDSMFFDIYLTRTSGADIYLGNSDFMLTYNHGNFNSPSLNYVNGSNTFKNANNVSAAYNEHIATEIITLAGINQNKLVINIQQPVFSSQGEFQSRIALIDNTVETHKLGTFYVLGLTDPSQGSGLEWVSSGGLVTKLFRLDPVSPWKSTRIAPGDIAFNDPASVGEPTAQASGLQVTGRTDTSITLSWARGNGDNVILLSREGAAVGAYLPADGLSYASGSGFGNGAQIGSSGVYVVYNDNGTSATVSGLSPNTTYHFAALEYSGTGGYSENYYVSSPATVSATTNTSEPAAQATGFVFTSFGVDELSFALTPGDGSNRIILVREGSPVDGAPADGSSYNADLDFGSGAEIGSGNYVVYNGNGDNAAITGLDPNKVYYFAVFEYNGSGGTENYLTADPLEANRSTLAPEPSASATAEAATGVSPTEMTINWSNGDGNRRIVVFKAGTAVDASPVDGTAYIADNNTYTSGSQLGTGNYVVYDGAGTSVTVYNLTPGTAYHYAVYEFNGQGDSANYKTASPATGSQTTYEEAPSTASSGMSFTSYTATSLTLEFAPGDGTSRIIIARPVDAVNVDPVNGTSYSADAAYGSGADLGNGNFVIYNGSDDQVTVTGLTPGVVYHFEVFEYNGSAGTENYLVSPSLTGDRTTLADEPSAASTGGSSSGVTTTSITFSWNKGDGAGQLVLIKAGSSVDADPADGTSYTASAVFGAGSELGTGNYAVYQGTDTFVTVSGLDPNETYYFEVFEVNGSGESSNYLTAPTLTGNQVTLDDAPSAAASNLVITNVTTSGMTLTWTSGNGNARVVVARAVSAVDAAPVNGNAYAASAVFGAGQFTGAGNYVVYNGNGNTVNITGLSQDTVYHFAVYEYNGAAGSENFLTASPATGSENTAIAVDITVLLEGPFNGTDMNTDLNVSGYLPLAQPYNAAPWNYAGTEAVGSIPNADIVDWVYVEVRKASSAATAVSGTVQASAAGFLLKNGSVVGLDGSSSLVLSPQNAGYGELYVVVYHRNHIAVLSANTLTFNGAAFAFDYTSGAAQAYGVDALKLGGGKYLLYAGNASVAESVIGASDRSAAWTERMTSGYKNTDVNLDGNVDSEDRSIIYNNSGEDDQTP